MRLVSPSTVVLFCLGVTSLGGSQSAIAQGEASAIRGEVIDLDSKLPVSGAEVKLLGLDRKESARAVTDVRGRFEIARKNVAPTVSVAKRGYIAVGSDGSVNGKAAFHLREMVVGPSGLPQIGMRRSASIAGVVTTTDGRELDVPIRVTLEGLGDRSDVRLTVRTEPNGHYKFEDLPPGDYRLVATSRTKLKPPLMSDRYMPTYYPLGARAENAGVVSVDFGQSLHGVDWVLAQNALRSIGVRVNPRLRAQVSAASFAHGLIRNGQTSGRGEFVFHELPDGRYVLTATTVGLPSRFAAATIQLDSDLNDLRLDFQPAASVRGRVLMPEASSETLTLSVALSLTDGDVVSPLSAVATPVAPDGQFAIDEVFGPRKLLLTGLPEHCRVSEVAVAGEAKSVELLQFEPGETSLLDIKVRCN